MATKKKTTVDNDIIDIDLSITKKQRYRIDGDNNRILELNIQDMNMPSRLYEALDEIESITDDWGKIEIDENSDDREFANQLKELDTRLREKLDYIFDTNISEVTAPQGSMFDFIKGKFRYEYILETFTKLYETIIAKETQLMLNNMQKHTTKYTKKK